MQPNPPYPQYPPVPPPAPKPKRRGRKILFAVLAVFGVIIVGSALASGGDEGTGAAGTTNAAGDKAKIGTEVRDGKFAFTVTKVDTGVDHVGGQFTRQNPQGQFVLVHVTVQNIGDEAQLFDASSQTLFDAQGRKYDADSGIAAIALEDSNAFLNNINPGNSVAGILLYDVPEGLAPTKIELHDSPFSGGVTVTLSK